MTMDQIEREWVIICELIADENKVVDLEKLIGLWSQYHGFDGEELLETARNLASQEGIINA